MRLTHLIRNKIQEWIITFKTIIEPFRIKSVEPIRQDHAGPSARPRARRRPGITRFSSRPRMY